jgi:Helix-turn-helix domain
VGGVPGATVLRAHGYGRAAGPGGTGYAPTHPKPLARWVRFGVSLGSIGAPLGPNWVGLARNSTLAPGFPARDTSSAEAAARMDIDPPALSRLETGKLLNATLATLHKWAEALGQKLDVSHSST